MTAKAFELIGSSSSVKEIMPRGAEATAYVVGRWRSMLWRAEGSNRPGAKGYVGEAKPEQPLTYF